MQKRVFNLIIVDESGSMSCIENQALAGMNETLSTIVKMDKMFNKKLHGVTILCSFFITFAPAKRAGKYKEQVSRSSLLIPGDKHSYWLVSLSARQLEQKKTMYAFGFFSYVQ